MKARAVINGELKLCLASYHGLLTRIVYRADGIFQQLNASNRDTDFPVARYLGKINFELHTGMFRCSVPTVIAEQFPAVMECCRIVRITGFPI